VVEREARERMNKRDLRDDDDVCFLFGNPNPTLRVLVSPLFVFATSITSSLLLIFFDSIIAVLLFVIWSRTGDDDDDDNKVVL